MNNKLGALVKHALQNRESIQVGLATATFFRGDRTSIIPDDAEFARFDLAYDEYLETCQFLRSFSYDFVISRGSFADPLRHLFDRKIGKTIVYIPAVNSSSSLGTKMADVNVVLQAIAGTDTPTLADIDKPVMRVKRGDEWVRVVNLVDEMNRAAKTEAIIAAHSAPDAGDIDVVIALGMLKEGANWRWADREIIIGHRGSLTEILQMVGRILRDVAGKTSVEVFHVLPFRFDQLNKERTREELNDYLTAILLSMLLENVMSPLYLPAGKGDGGGGEGARRINYFKEAFAEEGQAIAALAEITARVVDATATDCGVSGIQPLAETFPAIVSEVLAANGIQKHHDEIARQLFRMFSRRTAALDGCDVGHVDVDLVKENPFGCLLQYASDACGISTFRDLRAASRARALMPFEQARAFVQQLQLTSVAEWREYCGSGNKPTELPSDPSAVYSGKGWSGFGDWLGTGRLAPGKRNMLSFVAARDFVRSLELKSQTQWREYCASGSKPVEIPSNPAISYRQDGWTGYSDWLGNGRLAKVFRPFDDARAFVHGLHLKSRAEWTRYCKSGMKPTDIPSNPEQVYRARGWKGVGDWLGTGSIASWQKVFLPFHDAREYVRSLVLTCERDWLDYCKSGDRPSYIPSNPAKAYKGRGWSGVKDWLGAVNNSNPKERRFRSFQEARQYVQTLGLRTVADWRAYAKSGKRPPDIPVTPDQVYRDAGWAGFDDWLRGECELAFAAA
jgi:hypothetical protein